jgi:energy-coupling factor transporter ATP-binding protein EcfA2
MSLEGGDTRFLEHTLSQLAEIEGYQFLSKTPGFRSQAIYGSRLYIKISPRHLLNRSAQSPAEERMAIRNEIRQFLQRLIASPDLLSGASAPLLSKLEFNLRRMGLLSKEEAQEDRVIRDLFGQAFSKIVGVGPGRSESQHPSPRPSSPPEPVRRSDEGAEIREGRQGEHLELREPRSTQDVGIVAPVFESEAEHKEIAPLPEAPPLSEGVQRGVLVANTAWFFGSPVQDEDLESCVSAAEYWEQLSKTQIPLQTEQWALAARASLALLKAKEYQQSPEVVQRAVDLFLRFFICHNRSDRLPPEFVQLFRQLRQTTDVMDRCDFIQSLASCAPTQDDPNAVVRLKSVNEEYQSSRWRTCDLRLKGLVGARPWPAGKTDRQAILGLLRHLATSCRSVEALARPENLDNLCIGLLFILSAHSLYDQEWAESKKYFRSLLPLLEPLLQHLSQIRPQSDEDQQRANNFRKLFFFLQESNFVQRMDNERKPSGDFSIWGMKRGTSDLVGNTKETFTIEDLYAALAGAREVAKRGRRKSAPKETAELFHAEPLPPVLPPRGGIVQDWGTIFYESTAEDLAASWTDRQEAARRSADAIVKAFSSVRPSVDFLTLVRALQEGGESVDSYLQSMEDQGLTLLKDYVYPYIVLMRLAQTDREALPAKFIAGAASAGEVCSLGGEDRAVQIAVMKNVVRMMRPPTQEDAGGSLATSVIHVSQIGMLRTMASSIETGKQVYICNETGSGKTTMAKLAPQIVSFKVPMVLHVAPFTQAEKGWKRLTQWSDLDGVQDLQTPHFWITAADLGDLIQKGIPDRYKAILQKSFLLMDEYDSEAYRYVVQRPSGGMETTSVQDELAFTLGAQRLCNMSATPNLETFKNRIERYQQKLEETSTLPEGVREQRAAYYQARIGALEARRNELQRSMAREWSRSLTIEPLVHDSNPQAQIAQVFDHLRLEPFVQDKRGSVLVEMPRFVLNTDFVEHLHSQMESLFPGGPAAILFRDSDGTVQAHLFGPPWTQMPYEEFSQRFSSLDTAPPTVCFYAQDSVGGDFGLFSNERFVRSQHILYPGSIAPSYAIFQNLRRQRVNRGAPAAGEALVPSKTPVTIYMGVEAEMSLRPTPEEERILARVPDAERPVRLDELRKGKLIAQADTTGLHFSRLMETSRLKLKTIRKKQQILSEVLEIDRTTLGDALESLQQPLVPADLCKKELDRLFAEARANIMVGFDEEIIDARKRILSSIIDKITLPEAGPVFRSSELERHEAVLALHALFSQTISSTDQWDYIVKCLQKLYRRQTSLVDVLVTPVQRWAARQSDRRLNPVPSREAVEGALRHVRQRPRIQPAVDAVIPVPNERPGVPLLPPTDMVKAFVGSQTRDPKAAQQFLSRLVAAKDESVAFKERYTEDLKERARQLQQIEAGLHEYIDALGTGRPSVLLSEEQLRTRSPGVVTRVRKSEQYKRKHKEYSEDSL